MDKVINDINIDMEIRKCELITFRLKNIKEMTLILEGKAPGYKKYMSDKIFLEGVRQRLNIEKSLLNDLTSNDIFYQDISKLTK